MLKKMARGVLADEMTTLEEKAVQLAEKAGQYENNMELLSERLTELERSLLDEAGWQRLTGGSEKELSQAALTEINKLARIYWLKNPLIARATLVQSSYVFGQGVNIVARHPDVNAVVQAFLDDPKNKAELTSHQARMEKETELQLFANIFFAFFVNPATGRVRVRTIPPDEIISGDIICNPDDAKEPWYYKRVRTRKAFNLARGVYEMSQETTYYPDWRYNPKEGHPATIGGHPVELDVPVYHVSVNRLSDMKFGVSELYAAFDWAKAYKDFLSDWATIVKSYSRFAWKATAKGGAKGVSGAAAKFQQAMGAEKPPQVGGTFVQGEGMHLDPIKTSGPSVKAEDGRRLLLMVSAATGIYEHYFGDPSTGNMATTKSMERPMELKFLDRQTLWKDVFLAILNFVVDQAVKAPGGPLKGTVTKDEEGEEIVTLTPDPNAHTRDTGDDGGPMDKHIDVMFPSILEKDVLARVEAIIKAATLDGKQPVGNIDLKTVTRMLLVALGEDDVDELLDQLFPDGETDVDDGDEDEDDEADAKESKSDRLMGQALSELREAIARMADAK